MVGSGFRERPADLFVAGRGGLLVAPTQGGRVGLYVETPAGFGVDDAEDSDGRQAQLPGIGHMGGDHLVAQPRRRMEVCPVGRVEEVGDDHDLTAPVLSPFEAGQSGGQVGVGARSSWRAGYVVEGREGGEQGDAAVSRPECG